jgi:glycosyltransferase involved in cell wall biosynthesis
MARRILYLVTEDWYFLSHRLPMARAARAAGYEVHVATRVKEGRSAIEKEGFTVHPLDWSRGSLSIRDSYAAIRAIRRLLKQIQPVILHNVALKPVLLGGVASLQLAPLAVANSITGLGTIFATDGNWLTSRLVRSALRYLLRRERAKTIVQNPDDRDFFLALGVPAEKLVLIPGSGVDTDLLEPLPEPSPPITCAYAGRMLAVKGVATLVEAFSLATKQGTPLQLLLAGDTDKENPGSLAPEQLREFASLYGIHWLGHVTDIREVWAKAHFAVLASRGGEGVPKSLLEAAACGRPMVATDVPGSREIAIDGVTGLTVPPEDAPALAAAMAKLAADAAMRERFGKAARELVVSKFSADAIGRETVALYDEMLRAQ